MKKNDFLTRIFQYIDCVSLFVFNKKHYFLISKKEYFILNMKLDLDIELKRKKISISEYNHEINADYYRNGIWQLQKNNFEDFLKIEEVIILNKYELQSLLFSDFNHQELQRLYGIVENKLAFNVGISNNGELSDFKKINQISSRLPLFYINFDTNVYLHMDWDRCHEDYVYENWFSKAMDFGYLIPDEFCYWKIDGRDFWKFRQI